MGNTTVSSGIAITVDNGAPTVAVTAPGGGATVAGTTTVTASASDNVGVAGVRFFADGAAIGAEDTAAPYSVSWDTTATANGSHTLTAVARDAVGNTTTSTGVTVTVGNVVLAVGLTAPTGGTTIAGTTALTATASDNAVGVQFLVDNVAIGAEDTTAPYSVAWDTIPIASGSHALTAVARDGAGNTTTSAPVTVIVSQTATRFENTDLAITYTDGILAPGQPPAWFHGSRSRDWSGRLASFNRSQGARATLPFQGTTVRWIGFLAPWAGIARVYIDNVFVVELDLYATTEQPQAVVFSRNDLTSGPHTLTVESTGRKNPASGDYAVVVDAFDVAPAMPHPAIGARTEESGSVAEHGLVSRRGHDAGLERRHGHRLGDAGSAGHLHLRRHGGAMGRIARTPDGDRPGHPRRSLPCPGRRLRPKRERGGHVRHHGPGRGNPHPDHRPHR